MKKKIRLVVAHQHRPCTVAQSQLYVKKMLLFQKYVTVKRKSQKYHIDL